VINVDLLVLVGFLFFENCEAKKKKKSFDQGKTAEITFFAKN